MRAFLRLALAIAPFGVTLALLLWTLQQNPFAVPMLERTAAQVDAALTRAMVRTVTPAWAATEMEAALAAEDLDRVILIAEVAAEHAVILDPALKAQADAFVAARTGNMVILGDCVQCIADIRECPSFHLIALCGLPVELTPVGDLNELRRAGLAYLGGRDVDEIGVTLAVVGLGATAVVVVTGGSSYFIKAGASGLRVARRIGNVTPAFARHIGDLADLNLRLDRLWPYLRGRVGPEAVIDMGRVGGIGRLADDLGAVVARSSVTDGLRLLRHVDGPQDAAALRRVAEASGVRTHARMEVLGKARVFRTLARLGDLALTALALIYAAVLQVLVFLAGQVGRLVFRALRLLV